MTSHESKSFKNILSSPQVSHSGQAIDSWVVSMWIHHVVQTHSQSCNLLIKSRVLMRTYSRVCRRRGLQAFEDGGRTFNSLLGSLTRSAARCLIHLTCLLLYTALNVVNSILWQIDYTTSSSSVLGQKYFCIHAPRKTSVTFHKSQPMAPRLLLGQWKASDQSERRQIWRWPIACEPHRE